jgi:pyrroloquinoline quinone biosynthesis protein D
MTSRPVAFERGVRLRREADGSALLLVPEGIVRLNPSAAAAIGLIDGRRSIDEVVTELAQSSYDAPNERIADDVQALFDRLRARRFVRW